MSKKQTVRILVYAATAVAAFYLWNLNSDSSAWKKSLSKDSPLELTPKMLGYKGAQEKKAQAAREKAAPYPGFHRIIGRFF